MSILDRIWRSSLVQWTILLGAFIAAIFSKEEKKEKTEGKES